MPLVIQPAELDRLIAESIAFETKSPISYPYNRIQKDEIGVERDRLAFLNRAA